MHKHRFDTQYRLLGDEDAKTGVIPKALPSVRNVSVR
jgi:hypothetical protein